MSVTVTLDIYSGLPNPSWELSNEQVADLVERLRSSTQQSLSKLASTDGRLGYRGFRIEAVQEKGLEATTFIHGGLADISRMYPSLMLGGADVEQWLLSTSEGAISGDLAEYVSGQIGAAAKTAAVSKGESWSAELQVAPPYDPGKWNNNPTILRQNNCYNYANDKITNTFAQPGRGSGAVGPYPPACSGTGAAAQRDGQISIPNPNLTPAEGHVVALVVSTTPGFLDYHWYRRDNNAMWSHKPGGTPAKNTDNSGRPISDPQSCDRGPYNLFCGWYNSIPARTRIN